MKQKRNLKSLFAILLLFVAYHSYGQVTDEQNLLLHLDIKCRELLDYHRKKTEVKSKMENLISRAQFLLNSSDPRKKSAKAKLEVSIVHIKRELKLLKLDIKKEEERIIRKGCPGIRF